MTAAPATTPVHRDASAGGGHGGSPSVGPAERLEAVAARLPWTAPAPNASPAARVDLRDWMPGVVDQIHHPTCTAAVVASIAGYHARRAQGVDFDASLLFNYRMSRVIGGNPSRRGSLLRLAFAAWREYGLIDESRWPFAAGRIDVDPPEACRRDALAHRDVDCWRLDEPALDAETYLLLLRRCLALGLPVTVELPLCPSIARSFATGVIPLPRVGEPPIGKHVVLLVGYDDELELKQRIQGGLLVHNSWGARWGLDGYGWLPYEFALAGLLRDSWVAAPDTGSLSGASTTPER